MKKFTKLILTTSIITLGALSSVGATKLAPQPILYSEPVPVLYEEAVPVLYENPKAELYKKPVLISNRPQKVDAYISPSINVTIDGEKYKPVKQDGTLASPIIYDDNTYLPIKYLAEELGLKIEWDEQTRSVVIKTDIDNSTLDSEKINFKEVKEFTPELKAWINENIIETGKKQVVKKINDKNYVLIMEETNTSGYTLKVEEVRESDSKLIVDYKVQSPSKDMATLQVISYPYIVLELDTDKEFENVVVNNKSDDVYTGGSKYFDELTGWYKNDGEIKSIQKTNNGVMILVEGDGLYGEIKLNVSEKTIIENENGQKLAIEDLKENSKVLAYYGPAVTRSIPPIGNAEKIVVKNVLVNEGQVSSIREIKNGKMIFIGTDMYDGTEYIVSEKTEIVDENGRKLTMNDIKNNLKVKVYYGPIMTASLPPQTSAHRIVIMHSENMSKIEGTVIDIKNGKDGVTAQIKTDNDEVYYATISLITSKFEQGLLRDIEVGSTVSISGKEFNLGNEKHLTAKSVSIINDRNRYTVDVWGGEIIQFEEGKLHVMSGDVIDIFEVDNDIAKQFYLGESVSLTRNENGTYDIERIELTEKDFEIRHTNMGHIIEQSTGVVREISKEKLVLQTKEGKVELKLYSPIGLNKGTNVTVEYLKWEDRNGFVTFYNEDSKIDMTVKKIERAEETGKMIVSAQDKAGMEYVVGVESSTVLNFSHSSLKVNDEITVYADEIMESYPMQVNAKKILK